MAAKKMFPPGEIDKLLGAGYDEIKLGISFRILLGQIVIQFSNQVEWVRMTSGGARKLAAMLTEKGRGTGSFGECIRGACKARPFEASCLWR